jgi:NAD-dependent dihydropyrimidine dehydrogenase PreA subunit
MPKPIIDEKLCTNCNTCVEICPVNVFESGEKKPKIKSPKECIGCRACEAQCPTSAIIVED